MSHTPLSHGRYTPQRAVPCHSLIGLGKVAYPVLVDGRGKENLTVCRGNGKQVVGMQTVGRVEDGTLTVGEFISAVFLRHGHALWISRGNQHTGLAGRKVAVVFLGARHASILLCYHGYASPFAMRVPLPRLPQLSYASVDVGVVSRGKRVALFKQCGYVTGQGFLGVVLSLE